MQTLSVGNVAQIDDITILSAISMTCWRTEGGFELAVQLSKYLFEMSAEFPLMSGEMAG